MHGHYTIKPQGLNRLYREGLIAMFSHRIISILVALGFIALVVVGSQSRTVREIVGIVLATGAALLLPDDMGEYAGNLFAPGLAKPVPGIAIRVAGWFLLLVESLMLLYLWSYS
jgi:hypothetical protein